MLVHSGRCNYLRGNEGYNNLLRGDDGVEVVVVKGGVKDEGPIPITLIFGVIGGNGGNFTLV